MKKIIPAFILIAILMVSGCAALGTTQIQYAASAPPEKLCTLRVAPSLTITQFNGEAVNWAPAWGHWAEVQIPEGTHAFVLTYNTVHGGASNIQFSGNFTAPRTYSMIAQPMSQYTFGSTTKTTIQIRIVDGVIQ